MLFRSQIHRNASLLEVVEALEGPIHLNLCLGAETCARQSGCPSSAVWADAQRAMTGILRDASIAELAEKTAKREPVATEGS